MKTLFLKMLIMTLLPYATQAQPLEKSVTKKMGRLQSLITTAQQRQIDTLQEEMVIRTAEVFLKYADWDESHTDKNAEYFRLVSIYREQADTLAQQLSDIERRSICDMLDESSTYLTKLIQGEVFRKPSPKIDWHGVTLSGDQLTYQNRPVFLADYTWKPTLPELQEFYGQLDGFYTAPTQVINAHGDVTKNVLQSLKAKPDGTLGFIFIANNKVPKWMEETYGPEFTAAQGAPFHNYDIDHPGSRKMMSNLLKAVVPYTAEKKYSELGYMLCNEPRWITYKDGKKKVWYNSGVSDYTTTKFKKWLQHKHGAIAQLNELWDTDYTDFDSVQLDIPIDISLIGSAQWYDWNAFNDARVLDWFTFMKREIRKHDPTAKTHMKIMPSFFTDNDPCTGIDLEALTEMSDIIGNDCAAAYNNIKATEAPEWKERYCYDWRELYMGYDFLKSVSPGQIIFNTESHLLSTGHARDLFMDPEYARSVTWAAHTLGLSASQIWYWPRREDGSLRGSVSNGYAGSNNQQPHLTSKIHSTMMDLNAYSEEIIAMQRQRKPLRIFYSRTAATQKREYMDQIFNLYESLNFDGISLGFATQRIIERHDNKTWDAILVHATEQITRNELYALQTYLNHGGTVLIDTVSLKRDEYGRPLPALVANKGKLVQTHSIDTMKKSAFDILAKHNQLPPIHVTEKNDGATKGCIWKCIENSDGHQVVSVINVGKTQATISVTTKEGLALHCKDLIKGISITNPAPLKPYEVLFVEVK